MTDYVMTSIRWTYNILLSLLGENCLVVLLFSDVDHKIIESYYNSIQHRLISLLKICVTHRFRYNIYIPILLSYVIFEVSNKKN